MEAHHVHPLHSARLYDLRVVAVLAHVALEVRTEHRAGADPAQLLGDPSAQRREVLRIELVPRLVPYLEDVAPLRDGGDLPAEVLAVLLLLRQCLQRPAAAPELLLPFGERTVLLLVVQLLREALDLYDRVDRRVGGDHHRLPEYCARPVEPERADEPLALLLVAHAAPPLEPEAASLLHECREVVLRLLHHAEAGLRLRLDRHAGGVLQRALDVRLVVSARELPESDGKNAVLQRESLRMGEAHDAVCVRHVHRAHA